MQRIRAGWTPLYFAAQSNATVAEVDLLVTWNFLHIVRFDKIRLFSAVNLELGYRALAIYSPREVSVEGEG